MTDRIEHRVQQRRTNDAGDTVWVDLFALPLTENVDEARRDLRSIPTRRIVKVHITETVEVLP